jgi:4-hydroxy-tetrahydrodipicolinate synthase
MRAILESGSCENTCGTAAPQAAAGPRRWTWPAGTLTISRSHPAGYALQRLGGSITALATPFRADGLDLEAFARLIEQQLGAGTQGVVVAGSTGEAHALDDAEFERLLRFAVERVAGRVPVLAGTGSANTRKTIAATLRARDCGVDAALVVTPYYVRPTQDGLLRHFAEVADHGGLPVVLYNVPGRTGCDMLPSTTATLARHGRIVGIKEARGDAQRIGEVVALKSTQFSVLSGDDPSCLRAMLAGADGVISVASNVAPGPMRALCDAALGGDADTARAVDRALAELYEFTAVESNPIPVKWCLHLLGLGAPEPRLPLLTLSAPHRARAARLIESLAAVVQARHSDAA